MFEKCKHCLNICECCEFKNTCECGTCKPFASNFSLSACNKCDSKTKYLPGDKVLIRHDLAQDTFYRMDNGNSHNVVIGGMLDFAGKVVRIHSLSDAYGSNRLQYRICEYGCLWTDEMFECKVV